MGNNENAWFRARPCVPIEADEIAVDHHPSGAATPPKDDLKTTRRLREVGDIKGVRVLDHIIISRGCYVSFVDAGYW